MSYQAVTALANDYVPLAHVGKVRDTYQLPNGRRLVIVSDRRSIFDFQLGFGVDGVGEILHAFNLAARQKLKELLGDTYRDDCVAIGPAMNEYLPAAMHNRPKLMRRGIVVEDLRMYPIESVMRYIITGNAFLAYTRNEPYCGFRFPQGLRNGSVIPGGPIWTPTTKAQGDHDAPLDWRDTGKNFPYLKTESIRVFDAFLAYARSRGVIVVDWKGEAGEIDNERAVLVSHVNRFRWGDELFTPDSSRFVFLEDYVEGFEKLGKGLPPTKDKEILRAWGKTLRIDTLDPKSAEDRKRVREMIAPKEVLDTYKGALVALFGRLYDMSLEDFQAKILGIAA